MKTSIMILLLLPVFAMAYDYGDGYDSGYNDNYDSGYNDSGYRQQLPPLPVISAPNRVVTTVIDSRLPPSNGFRSRSATITRIGNGGVYIVQ